VAVPSDISEKVGRFRTSSKQKVPSALRDGVFDPQGIVRDADGKVIDGRERFLFLKSVEATKLLTKGAKPNAPIPDVEDLANKTWELFRAEADLSDGKWSYRDAFPKANARHADMQGGWSPNGRSETTTLVPDAAPYFEFPLSPTGFEKMRPDLAPTPDRAKNLTKRTRIAKKGELLPMATPVSRVTAAKVLFRQLKNGKPFGRTHSHYFQLPASSDGGHVPIEDWQRLLEDGYPEVAGGGWGPIKIVALKWADPPSDLIKYPTSDTEAGESEIVEGENAEEV
jgi:hypothetical protein